jgi:hypothetical protein
VEAVARGRRLDLAIERLCEADDELALFTVEQHASAQRRVGERDRVRHGDHRNLVTEDGPDPFVCGVEIVVDGSDRLGLPVAGRTIRGLVPRAPALVGEKLLRDLDATPRTHTVLRNLAEPRVVPADAHHDEGWTAEAAVALPFLEEREFGWAV